MTEPTKPTTDNDASPKNGKPDGNGGSPWTGGRLVALVVAGFAALLLAGVVGGAVGSHAGEDRGEHRFNKRVDGPFGGGGGPGMMGRGHGNGKFGGKKHGGGMMGGPGGMPGGGPGGGGPGGGGPRAHLELFQIALRDHLDVTDAELQDALTAAVDDQLKAQEITKDQADAMKAHIKEMDDLLTRDLDKSTADSNDDQG